MQRDLGIHGPPLLATLAIVATLTFSFVHNSSACTVFVLTDGHRVLFCNNEDWTNPATRIWFVPGGTGYQGCVYVGFDDGWARGGMNSEGLACDWVGGFLEEWHVDSATSVRGNPTERLLESCATVDEAIQFFQNHSEPDFRRARIFVADRSGASTHFRPFATLSHGTLSSLPRTAPLSCTHACRRVRMPQSIPTYSI